MRLFWLGFGWANIAIGFVGMALPLLPTVPFLLVAAWSFARHSPACHLWLVHHPRLGPGIEAWWRHKAIPRQAKLFAGLCLAASLAAAALGEWPGWALGIQSAISVAVMGFILTRRSTGPADARGRLSDR